MPQSAFDTAHAFTSAREGDLVDHPSDPGGITNYGISLKFLQGYAENPVNREWLDRIGVRLPVTPEVIRSLTKDRAKVIFKRAFWDSLNLDDFPLRLAIAQYDCAVNTGIRQSVLLLQRAVCVDDDGILGPKTREALLSACAEHGDRAVALRLCTQRRTFYAGLIEKKPSLSAFAKGWNNRVDLLEAYLEEVA